jgi:hypothetical protein
VRQHLFRSLFSDSTSKPTGGVSQDIRVERPASPTVKIERLIRTQRDEASMDIEEPAQERSCNAAPIDPVPGPLLPAVLDVAMAEKPTVEILAPEVDTVAAVEEPPANMIALP